MFVLDIIVIAFPVSFTEGNQVHSSAPSIFIYVQIEQIQSD
jgi:hypothetical protein